MALKSHNYLWEKVNKNQKSRYFLYLLLKKVKVTVLVRSEIFAPAKLKKLKGGGVNETPFSL